MNILFWYLSAQILITLSWLLSSGMSLRMSHSEKLRFHYGVITLLFSVLIIQFFTPIQTQFHPLQKLWTETSQKNRHLNPNLDSSPPAELGTAPQTQSFHLSIPSNTNALLFLLALLGIAFYKMSRDLRLLSRIKKDSFRVKKIHRIEILAHDQITVPLTFWTPAHATIVVPTSILTDSNTFRMSVLHELQHHRQRDPLWMFALETFKVFGFLNPFAKMWIRKITDLQEFACDETLVDRSKVNSRQYARCLLQVAESSLQPEFAPACATGLLFRMGLPL